MSRPASTEPNQPSQPLGKDLEPFHVFHTASVPSKPVKRAPGGVGARRKIDLSSPTLPSGVEGEEQVYYEQLRREAFEVVWSDLEASIKGVLHRMNVKVFDEIVGWVLDSFEVIRSYRKNGVSDVMIPYPLVLDSTCKQVYTALVLTKNVEFVDDLLTFHELGLFLRNHGVHVANLSSLDFNAKAGIGGCLRHLLKQLVGLSPDFPDICVLASWYIEPEHFDKPVVVIIEDMERCDGKTLADFISILGEWAVKLPVILVFGVATTVDAPVKIFPSTALQHLQTFKFTLASPIDKMDALICEVLIKPKIGFHIGYEVASYLRDFFLKHDGTIASVIRALKVACVKHFAIEPLSFFGRGIISEDCLGLWRKQCELLPNEMLSDAFNRPSCQESSVDRYAIRTGEELLLRLLDLKRLRENWSSVVMCVCEAGKFHKIRALDIYCEALDPDLYIKSSEYFVEQDGRQKVFSMENCTLFSGECSDLSKRRPIVEVVQKLRTLQLASLSPLLHTWQDLTEGMKEINEKVKELQLQLKAKEGDNGSKEGPTIRRSSVSLSCLDVEKKSPVLNYEAALLLESMIRNYMMPMECTPSHEIICFKEIGLLRTALVGDPRRVVQTNLLMSPTYIQCRCCSKDPASLQPTMHDTAIMYKLSQEHGDLINLYDWYQSFKVAVSSSVKGKRKAKQSPKSKKRKVDTPMEEPNEALLQARFCRAVVELQITGLLRMPSKRRPDFVQRIACGLW